MHLTPALLPLGHLSQIVFWDQRTAWLELLYRHQVTLPASRIEPVLEGLHKVLAATCPGLPEPVRNAFAKHLMSASVQVRPGAGWAAGIGGCWGVPCGEWMGGHLGETRGPGAGA